MEFVEKVKSFLEKIDKKEAFIVFLVFVLAFAIRAHLMIYELFFEFDTYFHARMASYVIENLSIPTLDWMNYYQFDSAPLPAQGAFFWAFTALIYKTFTLGAQYNQELWIGFVKVLPALFGALTVIAIYFLGKEMYDKKTGIVMAFFAAVVPAYVYRTMAGQFEEDSLGFLWMVIGFIFLVRALKPMSFHKKAVGNAILSGLFFGIMAWTWEMFLLVPMIIAGYVALSIIVMWFNNEKKQVIVDFVKVCAVTFVVFSILAVVFTGTGWIKRTTDYVVQYAPLTPENIDRASQKGEGVLAVTVGEENLGHPFWFEKYNALIIFPFLAVLLIPFKVWKRKDRFGLILLVWIGITMFMAFNKLKFTYTFGIPVAFSAGIVFSEILEFAKHRSPFEKKSVMVSFALFALIGVGAASIFMSTKMPTIEAEPGWKEALYWMKGNLPENSKLFNWWDQGHWFPFVAGQRSIIDNRNLDLKADGDYGLFVLSESEQEAYDIVKSYGAEYVVVGNDMLSKLGSIGLYAYNTTNFSDPRITKYFGVSFNCSNAVDPLKQERIFTCGPNTLFESQMNGLPTEWLSSPNQLIEQTVPGYVYTNENKSFIFLFNDATNKSMVTRLWFGDPSITKFTEIYSNDQVKIFRVNN